MKAIVTDSAVLVSSATHRILDVPDHVVQMVRTIGQANQHAVPIIKYLRVEYNLGLKQAKDLYDGIRNLPATAY